MIAFKYLIVKWNYLLHFLITFNIYDFFKVSALYFAIESVDLEMVKCLMSDLIRPNEPILIIFFYQI